MAVRDRIFGLLILPLAINALLALVTPRTEHNHGFDFDGVYYGAMALRDKRLHELSHTAPFCHRILTPWLASRIAPLLPQDALTPGDRVLAAFRLLALISNCITLAGLYALLHAVGLSGAARVSGVLLYAGIFWTIKFSYYSPAYIDFQTQMFTVLILWLTITRRYGAVPLLLAAAAIQKEPALYVLPAVLMHYWHDARSMRTASIIWTASALALPTAALIAVRRAITPVNEYSAAGVLLSMLRMQLSDPGFYPWLTAAMFSGLGILPVLLLANARAVWRFLRRLPHWLVLAACGLPLLFGAYEKARYFLFLTIPLVVAAASVVHTRLAPRGMRAWLWLGVTLLCHLYLGHQLEPMGTFEQYLNRMVPIRPEPPAVYAALLRGLTVSVVWLVANYALSEQADRDAGRSPA